MGCVCLRLYVVCVRSTDLVSSQSHYYNIELKAVRGGIFDRRGRPLADADYDNYAVLKPASTAIEAISALVTGAELEDIAGRLARGVPVAVNIGKAALSGDTGVQTVRVYKRYGAPGSPVHIIGYVSGEGGVCGIEKGYEKYLNTGLSLTVKLPVNAVGGVIGGERAQVINENVPVPGVFLTIDSGIQRAVDAALDEYSVDRGGAMVLDVGTGAVLACASRPLYDPCNVGASLDDPGSPFVNRALGAYSVGSVFKTAVAAAALEDGLGDFECECEGSCVCAGTRFHCSGSKPHGRVDMKAALEKSCNIYFIRLAEKLGAQKLLDMAEKLGFGQEIRLCAGVTADAGTVPDEETLENPAQLANFAFGQGRFTACVPQIAQMMCAAANGGRYVAPYLVESVTDRDGKIVSSHVPAWPTVAFSSGTAEKLRRLLTAVVEEGNACRAKPRDSGAAGKTATAQTGVFDENGREICNTWFGGFFPADEPEYVVVVFRQGGTSGAEDCAPVFRSIADRINSAVGE
ncbi:MAG: penicillin-binding protein 2 [Clostridia bacterium]|nr:penicillin-binding protein 2 [Clostridia bacterium]